MSQNHNTDDTDLFRLAMQGVTAAARSNKVSHDKARIDTTPHARLKDEQAALAESQHEQTFSRNDGTADDELRFYQPGVRKSVVQKLQRGQYSVQDELDLHGYTVAQAETALQDFLLHVKQRQLRCVRMVPGKGLHSQKQPVLRQWLVRQLRQREAVLAFCPAPLNDGGSGALYVLLRW